MNLKATAAFAICISFALGMCGCNSKNLNDSQLESAVETYETNPYPMTDAETVSEAVTDAPYVSDAVNPLTGEKGFNEEAVGKRPVAVMVNNIKESLPQYGIEAADIIYEIPVEGGITRLMAVYADYTAVPDVCSIRSCRYYYPILAYGMDAVYFHWGADKTIAEDTLYRLGIDHFDGGGSTYDVLFFRDEVRAETYSSEHTGYLKGSEIPAVFEDYGIRTDLLEENSGNIFMFNPQSSPLNPEGVVCMNAVLNFSQSYYSTFEYDSLSGTYKKYHSGEPHMDSSTGNQLAYTNVFALFTDVSLRGVGALVDVELESGEGYYISQGFAQKVFWEKPSENQGIKIMDEAGNEISVSAGKSYIGIIDDDQYVTIE